MSVNLRAEYPFNYETEVLLRDGSRILIRPIRRDDIQAWLAFIQRLGSHTKYLRFHHVISAMSEADACQFCTVDYQDSFALVAEIMREQHKDIIAVARYYRIPDRHSAEVAVAVEDDYQGKGLGTKLMEYLVNIAGDNGITAFECDVLAENDQMISILRNFGFCLASKLEAGVYHFTFPIN